MNARTLEWTARKLGLALVFEDRHRDSAAEILEQARAARYVIVPAAGAGVFQLLPAAALQEDILRAMADATFARVPAAVGDDTGRYALFVRADALRETVSISSSKGAPSHEDVRGTP